MDRMERIATRSLKPGMTVDSPIMDAYGRSLVEPGTILTSFIINGLLKKGITIVYIRKVQNKQPKAQSVLDPAKQHRIDMDRSIERLRRDDPSKIEFSDNVRKRILDGIQFIYKNPNPRELASATDSLASELLNAMAGMSSVLVDINALKVSDEYTFKHSVDVAAMSMVIGKKLGLKERELHELASSGLLHDLGKIHIPDEILNKPGRLSEEEYDIIKNHSLYGYNMIKDNPDVPFSTSQGVLQHHEKLCGGGYPYGISGDSIKLYGRILSVADIYDALVTVRPYKSGKSPREAIEIIMSMTDALDIDIINALLNSMLLYPVDSIVELSNGEHARVLSQGEHHVLRPTVLGLESGNVYELDTIECSSLIIL